LKWKTHLDSESVRTEFVEGTNAEGGSSPKLIIVERFSYGDQRGVDFLGANVSGRSRALDLSSEVED
jgi:hypothetical protein